MQLFSLTVLLSLISFTLSCGTHGIHRRDVPKFNPLPPSAAGLPLNSDGYFVESLGHGTYMITDGIYNSMFLVSTHGVVVVDLPPTTGHRLLWAVGNVTCQPITHFVYSHMHADHIGGAFLLTAAYPDALIIAHTATKTYLAQLSDHHRPAPHITFETSHTLHVGNQTLELAYKGQAHMNGNIYIYAPAAAVLMLVDVVFPGWIPFSQLGQTENVREYIAAHDHILAYDFKYFIGGHLGRAGNRSDVLVNKEYVGDLFTNCLTAINLTATNDPVLGVAALLGPVYASNPGNYWAAFSVYLSATTEWCANQTNAKWATRLVAADVFQYDNAGVLLQSLRVDYGFLGPFGAK
ncbi:beta-lactamase-like protein [Mycena alexandri]|uniref:Beta-lactamase-like protein n=1 Tax=Mycena alexandri TaxID=1745969 RepID=A0AAD6SFK9_9AGAR|nr:beta-lactamase-like protein [Mycena alexandri]